MNTSDAEGRAAWDGYAKETTRPGDMKTRAPSRQKSGAKYVVPAALALVVFMMIRRTRNRRKLPGRNKALKTRGLETAAAWLQELIPVEQITLYLDGFHFESGHPPAHRPVPCHGWIRLPL